MSDAAHRRRRHADKLPGVASPLLIDWLDSEPVARGHLERVLVVGTRADAEVFGASDHVEHAASPELIPAQRMFDLVVAVDCLTTEAVGAQLDRLAGAVGDGGRLLVIAAARAEDEPYDGPPWPLTQSDIEAFPGPDLRVAYVERLPGPAGPTALVWRAMFERPAVDRAHRPQNGPDSPTDRR
jgi:hypothetical protein